MYQPPVDDYEFLLKNVVDVEQILAAADDGISIDDVSDILGHAGEFAVEVFAPLNPVGDREGLALDAGQVSTPAGFRDAYHAFVGAGWGSMATPKLAGGEGMPLVVATAAREFWSAANFALALCPTLSEGAVWAIAAAGDEDIKPKWIPQPDGTLGARNAVETVSIEYKLGIHASPTCVLAYDNAIGYLVGQRHYGLMAMFVMMDGARQGTGIQALAVADRAYQQARSYAAERIQGPVLDRPAGTPISEHPDVRRLVLSMSSALSAIRALLGQGDIDNSTALHIPELDAVVAGDVAYNGIHSMLALTGPAEWRQWIASIDKIAALNASTVIAGHKRPALADTSAATLDRTRDYIEAFIEEVENSADFARHGRPDADPLPRVGNPTALVLSAVTAFKRKKHAHQ